MVRRLSILLLLVGKGSWYQLLPVVTGAIGSCCFSFRYFRGDPCGWVPSVALRPPAQPLPRTAKPERGRFLVLTNQQCPTIPARIHPAPSGPATSRGGFLASCGVSDSDLIWQMLSKNKPIRASGCESLDTASCRASLVFSMPIWCDFTTGQGCQNWNVFQPR